MQLLCLFTGVKFKGIGEKWEARCRLWGSIKYKEYKDQLGLRENLQLWVRQKFLIYIEHKKITNHRIITKLGFIKTENSCSLKSTPNRMKRQNQ